MISSRSDEPAYVWQIVNPATGNVVNEYDSEAEAKDAVWWYAQSFHKQLEVRCVAA